MYVLVGSGGFHQGESARTPDFLTPYLTQVWSTLGLFNPHFNDVQGWVVGDAAVRLTLHTTRARLSHEPLVKTLVGA